MASKDYTKLEIQTVTSPDLGCLHFFEAEKDLPFPMKRIYYITGVSIGQKRGFHAHKKLKQLIFCPYGKVELLLDDGKRISKVLLDSPNKGVVITGCLWREMLWLVDQSVLCVAADDYYDESDYIRNYDDFINYQDGKML